MEKPSNLKVYFDLNEVDSMLQCHAFTISKEACKVMLNDFKSFITGYAPYSIVSDIASNYDYFLDGREHVNQLDSILNLHPVHLNDRLEKASKLSLARSAFWINFFTNKNEGKKLQAEDFIRVMDSIYKNLKYQCSNGFDAIARYLSFLFANRDISINQIEELSSHMVRRSVSLSYKTMGLITMLATFCSDHDDVEKAIVRFYVSAKTALDSGKNKIHKVEAKNQTAISLTNFLFLCKTLEWARYAKMEEASEPVLFSTVLKQFLRGFVEKEPRRADLWLTPLHLHYLDDISNAVTFGKEVIDILKSEK